LAITTINAQDDEDFGIKASIPHPAEPLCTGLAVGSTDKCGIAQGEARTRRDSTQMGLQSSGRAPQATMEIGLVKTSHFDKPI
jgi:hypothetical protein